jgi:hypothetical protein
MYTQNDQVLSRPKNALDLPAMTILALATVGTSAVRLAYALDVARAESIASTRGAPSSRRPSMPSTERDLVGESWRVK